LEQDDLTKILKKQLYAFAICTQTLANHQTPDECLAFVSFYWISYRGSQKCPSTENQSLPW